MCIQSSFTPDSGQSTPECLFSLEQKKINLTCTDNYMYTMYVHSSEIRTSNLLKILFEVHRSNSSTNCMSLGVWPTVGLTNDRRGKLEGLTFENEWSETKPDINIEWIYHHILFFLNTFNSELLLILL